MNTSKTRIDQSDKLYRKNTLRESWKSNIPLFPLTKTEELKSALVKRLSAEYADVGERVVYQAVNEANALASLTDVPLLVLPTLAEEKVQKAAAWSAHQRSLLRFDSFAFAA